MGRDEVFIDTPEGEVRVSSPDKVVFPDQGWNKLDVVSHYLACGDGALRGVYGRPTVLKRWNKGVRGEPFFQKRAPKDDEHEYATIRFPSGRSADLLVPRYVSDIAWMAQLNCLDLNPWPVRAEDVDHPDELRIDLDPTPEASFTDVREVALCVGEVLEEHGLVGWPKTSGSRGMHINVRIEPRWSFTDVRRAALALAREVERRLPDQATSAWWKEERHGVFLDYNQNARDRTVASAYSVRPTGFVSAPVTWDEVPEVETGDFPMGSFAEQRYAAVGDIGAGIDEAVGTLELLLDLSRRDEEEGLGDGGGGAPPPPPRKKGGEQGRVNPSRRREEG